MRARHLMQHGLQHVVGLVDLFARHGLDAQFITASGLTTFFSGQRLVIRDIRFGFVQRLLVARLVNGEQHLIFFDQLVIVNHDLSNQPGDVGRDGHHIGAETRIARPRRFGVVNPGTEDGDEGQRNQRQRDRRSGYFSCKCFHINLRQISAISDKTGSNTARY